MADTSPEKCCARFVSQISSLSHRSMAKTNVRTTPTVDPELPTSTQTPFPTVSLGLVFMRLFGKPVVWFITLIGILTLRSLFMDGESTQPSNLSDYLARAAFGYTAACWASRDARKRSADGWPMDHVMFFSFILLPAYIVVTRKWKGVGILIVLAVCLTLPYLA